jgi:hypothetical protein
MSSRSELRVIAGVAIGMAGLAGLPIAWLLSNLSPAKWGTGNGVGVLVLSIGALVVAAIVLTPWASVRREAARERTLWRSTHNRQD